MFIVVLMLGLVAFGAGIAAVAFGLAIKEFSLGSTLLIAGTTSLVGGLVMIAIAAAVRELHRIATALATRPAAPRFPRPGEPFDPYAPGAFRPPVMNAPRTPPVPPPPYGGPEAPARGHGPSEPRLQAAAAPADAVPEPREPTATILQPVAQDAAEPPVVEESDTIPLSPHERSHAPSDEPDAMPQHDADAASAVGEPPTEPERRPTFDAIWPPRERERRDADDVPSHDDAAAADAEIAHAPAPPTAASQDAFAEEEERESEAAEQEAPHAVSILKSGMVDGMAYTLYSDGSIEAELPSGTIRFESITALRMHLEKAG